jgi:hypothetical protein
VAGAAVFNGGRVTPVVVDEAGWVLQLERDSGVRRQWSIEGKGSSEGRSPEGGGRSPARRRGSGGRKPGEVDGWAVGKHVRRSDDGWP